MLLTFFILFSTGALFAQVQIQGIISDINGDPLIGVNVIEKGTTHGTVTDFDGGFTLSVESSNSVLTISYIGFRTQEIAVDNRTQINITMIEDTQSLEELIVVGYGSQAKKDITGSVAVVKAEDLLASTGSSAAQQLQGKAAGVYVGQTGSPGSATMVRIRGINTVNDNGPLYVIDGVSTRNQNLSSLNPNDIESMQVLKDASAAAIYGAQAANGVILITTKQGSKSGKPTLSYDGYFGIQKTTKKYDLLNSADRLAVEWESQQNSFDLRGVQGVPENAQFGKGATPSIPNYLTTAGAQGKTDISMDDYSFPNNQIAPYSDTDWWNEIDRTAPIQNHQLSLSGGNESGQYVAGLNFFDQQGTVVDSYYKRFQTRLNSTFEIRDWFRVGENLSYTWSKDIGLNTSATESNHYSWVYRASAWVPVKDSMGNWAGSKFAGTGNFENIVANQHRNKDNYFTNSRIFGNVWAELDFFKDITYRTSFGIDYTNQYYYRMAKTNLEFSESPGTNNLEEQSSFNFRWVWTNTVNYKQKFNDVHAVDILLGTEAIRDGLGRGLRGQRYGFLFEDNQDTWVLAMGENDNRRVADSWYNGEFALFGMFARFDYAYADKYLLTGIVRRDGVSRFSKDNRYGTFPSLSAGWRMSEENFMEGSRSWLDDLKIRAGYGVNGNSEMARITNYAMEFGTNPQQTNYDLGGVNTGSDLGYRLARFGNEDTKWEATEMVNLGIDIAFLNKFTATLELYQKKTTDMLIEAAYSHLANHEIGRPYINYGDMENKGFDFDINYRDNSGDWSWEVGMNMSAYKNEVQRLSEADDFALWGYGNRLNSAITRTTMGRPISEFFGYNVIGFYDSEEDVLNSPIPYGTNKTSIQENPGSYIGKFKFEDTNGDGVINADDRKVIGNPHPDLMLGLNASVTYKNWDMTMFWYSTIGNDLFNNTKYFTDFPLFGGNRSTRMRDLSWKKGADNSKAILPILDSADNWGGAVPSSYYVENGSFLKLKNLVVGYTLPKHITEKATISNLRVYVQAENLLTFTSYNGLDPEITNRETGSTTGSDISRGIDGGGWPTTMRLLFGVNLTF